MTDTAKSVLIAELQEELPKLFDSQSDNARESLVDVGRARRRE